MKMFRVASNKTECFIVAETEREATQMFLDEIGEDPTPEEMPQDSTFSVIYDRDDIDSEDGPVPGVDVPVGATIDPGTNFNDEVVEWWVEAHVSEWCELHKARGAIVVQGGL